MREIKFRAWDKNLKKWCDGNDAHGFNLFGETHLIGGILHGGYYSHNVFERLFADVEVMQFTGLHDKNGKEIWEGDIVTHESVIKNRENGSPKDNFQPEVIDGFQFSGVNQNPYPIHRDWVDYNEKPFNREVKWIGDEGFRDIRAGFSPFQSFSPKELVVIGNVYENPELLKP